MTTPSAGGGGDGLIRPLNAPSGQQALPGIQPGTSGGVTLAQYVIVYGTGTGNAQGVFVYNGSPGPGNQPVFSITNGDEDPYGNPVAPGIFAGQYGSNQAGLDLNGQYGQLVLPTGQSGILEAGGMAAVAVGGATGSITQVFGGRDTASGPGSDRVLFDFTDSGPGFNAAWYAIYIDQNNTAHTQIEGNYSGTFLPGVRGLSAVQPGSGTSATNYATGETWHYPALINGWANQGGANVPFGYCLRADGTVDIKGVINGAAATSDVFFTLPTGYIPQVQQPAGAVTSTAYAAGWVQAGITGNLSLQSASMSGVWLVSGSIDLNIT